MDFKSYFEVFGRYIGSDTIHANEYFPTLEDANEYAMANLEEYVIYMKMKIEEKRNDNG